MSRPQVLAQEIIGLLTEHHLLSSRSLLQKLLQVGKKYNKTSVYRALETLAEQGTICSHDFTGKETLYELRDHHHDHVVCSLCGTVAEAPCSVSSPQRMRGFKIDHHHVTYFGTCPECQRA